MHELLQKLAESVDAECGAIMFYNKRKDVLYCMAEFNLPEKWKLMVNEPDERSLNGTVYSSGVTIIKNNLMAQLSGHDVKSVLIVPIERDYDIVGTIELINKNHGLFDDKDRKKAAEAAVKIADIL